MLHSCRSLIISERQNSDGKLIGGPYPLDLNNDGVVQTEDTADVYTETKDANPDKDGWRNFAGLPHRCQQIADIDGVRYVNDSKGTNVGATIAALEGLGGERNIVLIAGGQGKGADFSQLQPAVARHCKLVVLIGEDAPLLQRALDQHVEVACAAGMDEAVTVAAAQALPGDCVLLSPACASFDMFSGYTERGDAFARAVRQIREGRS